MNTKNNTKQFYNQWKSETAPLEKMNSIKTQIDEANIAYQQAEREGNYAKASGNQIW